MNSISKIGRTVLISSFLMPLIMTPHISFDPINPIRLVIFSGATLLIVGYSLQIDHLNPIPNKIWLAITFLFSLVYVGAIVNHANSETFFGSQNRNVGLLSTSLIVLLIITLIRVPYNFSKNIALGFVYSSPIVAIYGFIQYFGYDFLRWNNVDDAISSSLGNSNFMSSYLALSTIFTIAYVINVRKWHHRWLIIFSLFMNITLIYLSESAQGFLILGVACLLILSFVIFTKSRGFFILFIALVLTSFVFAFRFVYSASLDLRPDDSLSIRFAYWKMGLRMGWDHWYFGVGVGNYTDWFASYRDSTFIERLGNFQLSDDPHNILLRLFTNHGLAIAASYLLFIFYVMAKSIRKYRSASSLKSYHFAIFIAWIGYIIQSMISVANLTIDFLGALIFGSLLNYVFFESSEIKTTNRKSGLSTHNNLIKNYLFYVFVIAGLLLSSVPLKKDNAYRRALERAEVGQLISVANSWPLNTFMLRNTSNLLLNNGFYDDSAILARKVLKVRPRDLDSLRWIYLNPRTTEGEKMLILKKLKKYAPGVSSFE